MFVNNEMDCCGLRELGDLSKHKTPISAMRSFGSWIYGYDPQYPIERQNIDRYDTDMRWRFAIFTQAGQGSTYGVRFAAFIRRHRLGQVIATKTAINPNSNHLLRCWVWEVNHDAVRRLLKKESITRFHGNLEKDMTVFREHCDNWSL